MVNSYAGTNAQTAEVLRKLADEIERRETEVPTWKVYKVFHSIQHSELGVLHTEPSGFVTLILSNLHIPSSVIDQLIHLGH